MDKPILRIARPDEVIGGSGVESRTGSAKGTGSASKPKPPSLEVVRGDDEGLGTLEVMSRLGVTRIALERIVERGLLARTLHGRRWAYDAGEVARVKRQMAQKAPALEEFRPVGKGLWASEVAARLGVEPRMVERLARQGFLQRRRVGTRWVYEPAEVEEVKSQLRMDAPQLERPKKK